LNVVKGKEEVEGLRFIGIALATSPKGPSIVALVEGDEFGAHLVKVMQAGTDEEILEAVMDGAGDHPVFVALDAPIAAERGSTVEGSVRTLYGHYTDAATKRFLNARPGAKRGPAIAALLAEEGILPGKDVRRYERVRRLFSTWSLPAAIPLFRLSSLPAHRLGSERGLLAMADLEAALKEGEVLVQKEQLSAFEADLKPVAFDAIVAASVLYRAWLHPDRCIVLGSGPDKLLMPVFPRREAQTVFPRKEASLPEEEVLSSSAPSPPGRGRGGVKAPRGTKRRS
jgi:predicted RNase H-like nuclease